MVTTDELQDQSLQVLAQVVRLLCRCTDLAFAGAVPGEELAALGLGAQLLADEAMHLLPTTADVDELVVGYDDPVQALRAAEAVTRRVPIEAFPAGASHLIVGICDLIREHPA